MTIGTTREFERHLVQTDASYVHVRTTGEATAGRPEILFLHQVPASSRIWVGVMDAIDGIACIAPDSLNLGESDGTAEPLSLMEQAEHLWQAAQQLRPGPKVVVGHHTGAALAAVLAGTQAEEVVGTVHIGYPYYSSWKERLAKYERLNPVGTQPDGSGVAAVWQFVNRAFDAQSDRDLVFDAFADRIRAGRVWYEGYVALWNADLGALAGNVREHPGPALLVTPERGHPLGQGRYRGRAHRRRGSAHERRRLRPHGGSSIGRFHRQRLLLEGGRMTSFPPLPAPTRPPVIVGAGNAGLAAAARLSQHGVRSILLEKEPEIGGQLRLSGGAFSAAGTQRQQQRGITDTAELHRDEVMRIGHHKATPHLVELATRHAGTTVDWIDQLGFPFEPTTPAVVRGHEPYSVPRTYWGTHPVNGGRAILETLQPHIDRDVVDVRTSHRLVELRVDPEGDHLRVAGVRVDTPQGETVIGADVVVLATGGYAAARDLIEEFQPAHAGALVGCLPHASGDVHRLLAALGVRIVGGDAYLPTMGMIEDPERPGVALRLTEARVIVDANTRPPWEIWINKNGERWVDETVTSPDVRERALLQQPGLTWWSVWNEDVLEAAPTSPIGPDWTTDQLRKHADRESWLIRTDTLDALAERIGVPYDALMKTVDTYNHGAGSPGAADPFGRTHRPLPITAGPYYAVRSVGAMLLSRGGPEVDAALQPVTSTGATIRGAHAIGELLGMSQFSGDAFAGGMSVGPALTFGVLIADRIAEAISRGAR